MRPRRSHRSPALAALYLTVGLVVALAGARASAQSRDDVDWSLPDPFDDVRPTSTTTPERVPAPAETVALSRPLVLRSVVVYGPSRPSLTVTLPSLRLPLVSIAPSAPAARGRGARAAVLRDTEAREEAPRDEAGLRTEAAREPAPRIERSRPRIAAMDPAVARTTPSAPVEPVVRDATLAAPAVVAPEPAIVRTPPLRRQVVEMPGDPPDVAGLRHMSADVCFARLRDTGTPFERLDATEHDGVEQPAILHGPLGGVSFRPYGTASSARVHQVVDCRLALALMRAAPVFRAAGIREVRYLSIYRPGARVASGSRAGHVSLHAHALAIDIPSFVRDDGTVLSVIRDWGPAPLGAPVCGPDAVVGTTDASAALRALACDLLARRAFQMILTPQYNAAHDNHFHMQLDPGEPRVSVR